MIEPFHVSRYLFFSIAAWASALLSQLAAQCKGLDQKENIEQLATTQTVEEACAKARGDFIVICVCVQHKREAKERKEKKGKANTKRPCLSLSFPPLGRGKALGSFFHF